MASIDSLDAARTIVLVLSLGAVAAAQESRFSHTNSRSQYVHWIELYDANERKIDPADPNAPPYSPMATCGKCHDYESISHGFHFNAVEAATSAGRSGEPWIWTDRRTGTQIPVSYRGWAGTYHPRALGITNREFLVKFGSHLPGGGPGALAPVEDAPASDEAADDATTDEEPADSSDDIRWKQSGPLSIDCMFCHTGGKAYNAEAWSLQIADENFAWAPTAAMGLGKIDGEVKSLPDDYDPTEASEDAEAASRLPRTTYDPRKFNSDQQVFFDITRKPLNNACYYCHTSRAEGEDVEPDWTHDEDVHLRAGMLCADCHRNGMGHHTVLGHEGEEHPTGVSVATLSCRGCHMDEETATKDILGGRLGAPKPLHKGLPPLHLDKLSCTACHSGAPPKEVVGQVQTAKAHGLGLPSHHHAASDPPGIVSPVLLPDGETLYPHRMMWPAFWGTIKDDVVTPLNPEEAYSAIRRVLRVRRDFTEELSEVKLKSADKVEVLGEERAKTPEDELTDEEKEKLAQLTNTKVLEGFQEKLGEALTKLAEDAEAGVKAVYISAGKAYRLADDGSVEQFDHAAAEPYAWKLGHDVRPARWAAGATGCFECHTDGAPMFEGLVTAIGPAPESEPLVTSMYKFQGLDKTKLDAWNQSFQGRTAFKYFGFASMAVVALILLLYLLLGINGFLSFFRRRSAS